MEVYINPMIGAGVLEMTEPDNPTSRNQMYVTVKVEQELENPLKVVPLIHSNLTPVKFSHSPFCLFLFSSYSSCPLCRVLH